MIKISRIRASIFHSFFSYVMVFKYRLLSDINICYGNPKIVQPIQMCGQGLIRFGYDVVIGTKVSPYLYSGYTFLNARNINTEIFIDNRVWTNNNLVIICEGEGVYIGEDTLIGTNVEIYDSDFHGVNPAHRKRGTSKTSKVIIGSNVWLGSNVKILKGVTIGNNSIIANGSIVSKSIPENVIAGGCPAEVIKREIDKIVD